MINLDGLAWCQLQDAIPRYVKLDHAMLVIVTLIWTPGERVSY
jgi:hypothetical protein